MNLSKNFSMGESITIYGKFFEISNEISNCEIYKIF